MISSLGPSESLEQVNTLNFFYSFSESVVNNPSPGCAAKISTPVPFSFSFSALDAMMR